MPEIRTPEWRASLATTNYPFADDASLSNSSGDFFPQGMFVDASLYIIGARARVYISKVVITSSTATLIFSDAGGQPLASAVFNILSVPDTLRVLDNYGRPAGLLAVNPTILSLLQAWTLGEHDFQLGSTEFVARVVIPTPEIGVRGFILADGTVFTGDVYMVGTNGVVLTSGTALMELGCAGSPAEYPFIRIDVVGDPLSQQEQCLPLNLYQTPQFLQVLRVWRACRHIDLVPNDNGSILVTVGNNLASDTVLRVRTTSGGLIIESAGISLSG